MTPRRPARSPFAAALALSLVFFATAAARAQSMPTASRSVTFAGFGAVSGAWSGIGSGAGSRNLSITAGLDVGFRAFYGLRPEVEIRGTYPIDSGHIVSEKSLLGGLKLNHSAPLGFNLYGNFLYGRGEMDYQDGGFPVPSLNLTFTKSSTPVYSLGGGAEHSITPHFALKADYQFQLWNTPVTTSGKAHPQLLSGGIIYRFSVDRYPYERRRRDSARTPPPAPAAAPSAPAQSAPPPPPQ